MNSSFLIAALLGTPVTFEVNDAYVKDKPVQGVWIEVTPNGADHPALTGHTDARGRFEADAAPGPYTVSYRAPRYVPIEGSAIEVGEDATTITTTLSMMMEAEGRGGSRRVRIVLNWGDDDDVARDLDAHLQTPAGEHVYFVEKASSRATLDVDDTNGGGPETITLIDPLPGEYAYWVYNYSQSKDPKAPNLGPSGVVVRVFLDDSMDAELKIPQDVSSLRWVPFDALVIGADGTALVRKPPPAPEPQATPPTPVRIRVNDAFVKDRNIEGAHIDLRRDPESEPFVSGATDASGVFATELEAGTYFVTYSAARYITIGNSAMEVGTEPLEVTTTLSMRMEAEGGDGARRVRIILNWGEGDYMARDLDGRLLTPDHEVVYFANRQAPNVALDVDDTDGGGPETITLTNAPAGEYVYWVHNWSQSLDARRPDLDDSSVLVRVLFDDLLAREVRLSGSHAGVAWRPFGAVMIGSDGLASLRPLLPDEPHLPNPRPPSSWPVAALLSGSVVLVALGAAVLVFVRRRKRR